MNKAVYCDCLPQADAFGQSRERNSRKSDGTCEIRRQMPSDHKWRGQAVISITTATVSGRSQRTERFPYEIECHVDKEEKPKMKSKPIIAYFAILLALCAGFVVGARMLGERGAYLAQGYMLTPALAAILTRLFFYTPRFKDAYLRFGRLLDYLKVWSLALSITAMSFGLYTLFGAIEWDLSGGAFLNQLNKQFALAGQNMVESLPPGITPKMMLLIFTLGGLTVFNIMPGLISGFGEEFGHRGFMFPQLYRIKPWLGLVGGGLIWFAWHLPLALIIPSQSDLPLGTSILSFAIRAVGSICAFTYFAYVYVKSGSIFVTSIAHIAMNNAASAFSYYIVLKDQLLADLGLTLTMFAVVGFLFLTKRLTAIHQLSTTESDTSVVRFAQVQVSNRG
jgi:membrane protease YdiL (CAAX protease family)